MDGQPLSRNGGRMIDAGSPPILYYLSIFFDPFFPPFFPFLFLRFSVNITFRVSIFFFLFFVVQSWYLADDGDEPSLSKERQWRWTQASVSSATVMVSLSRQGIDDGPSFFLTCQDEEG